MTYKAKLNGTEIYTPSVTFNSYNVKSLVLSYSTDDATWIDVTTDTTINKYVG